MKNIVLLAICISAFTVAHTQDTDPRTALVLIDIQEFYFDTTKSPLAGRFEATDRASLILEHFRDTRQEVVHIMHKGGGGIHTDVSPLPGEKVIVKQHVSCFRETPLLEYLTKREIKRLVIVGMMTHMCVEAATRAADDLGFETILIGDACATRDLKYGDEIVAAKDVHLSTLSTLRAYAKVTTAAEFLAE
jgi:nicotinamidase-related amidase